MKQYYLLLFVCLAAFASRAQFSAETSINSSFTRSHRLRVLDFENDGDSDIITTSNSSTQNTFPAVYNSFSQYGQEIVLLENDGAGNFTEHSLMVFSEAMGIATGDFNGDNRMDIAYINFNEVSGPIYILLNNGAYGYSAPIAVAENLFDQSFGFGGFSFVEAGDLDNDGDDEIVFGTTDNTIFPGMENTEASIGSINYQGSGFGEPVYVHSGQSVGIGGSGNGAGIRVLDFNGDNLNDIIYFGQEFFGKTVEIARGHADNSFGPSPTQFEYNYDSWSQFDIGDVDGDGILDFMGVFAELLSSYGSAGILELDNSLSFYVDTANPQAMDLNGDGKDEVISVDELSNLVILYNANGYVDLLPPVVIPENIAADISQLDAADFNGDGLEDLVLTAGGLTYIMLQQPSVMTTYFQDADNDGFGNALSTIQSMSLPSGYVENADDCNDNNSNIKPGSTELCNGLDDDCNGIIDDNLEGETFYRDQDNDGFGNLNSSKYACMAPPGYVSNWDDCNDNNASIKPGTTELCNGLDDDCDGTIDEGFSTSTFYHDFDGDGYGNTTNLINACIAPAGYVANNTDCNDNNPSIKPGATEVVNGVDDNCNGQIDEGTQTNFFRDQDGDGYGNLAITIFAATAPPGYVANFTDCNDNNANINPGATEICNGLDDDCDGQFDEGVRTTFYRDYDGDGFGNSAATTQQCSAPAGWVSNSNDCNDFDSSVKPGATEICNGVDDNCNGTIDEGVGSFTYYRDQDGDGFGNIAVTVLGCTTPTGYVSNSSDCNDSNFNIKPGGTEICNGLDDDCDGQIDEGVKSTFYRDQDADGFGNVAITTLACTAPAGYANNSADCNDNNFNIKPGATEICNGLDDDCDGQIDEGVKPTFYRDQDGDGYGNIAITTLACTVPAGYVSNSADCNDNNFNIKPGATEICNGLDDDCDGQIDEGVKSTFYRDQDADGFGNIAITTLACTAPAGYVSNSTDCNDNNFNIKPGATEICNGLDDDCDGQIDEGVKSTFYRDQDADGFGNLANTTLACTAPAGYVSNSNDCNDNNFNIKPGATEMCNGLDDDCDGQIDEGVKSTFYRDQDADGFGNLAITTLACTSPAGYVSNSTDCNDNNFNIKPGANEICNGLDDDCDGQIDEGVKSTFYRDQDADGFGNLAITTLACTAPAGYVSNSNDCDDSNVNIRPGATELCNGVDDDCDGQIDEGVKSTFYRDQDGDGFGNLAITTLACTPPSGYVSNSTDCNDNNSVVRPGATELCNGLDDDCDGLIDEGCNGSAPSNNEPAQAQTLSVSFTGGCSALTGNLTNATTSIAALSSAITGQDIWYKFTAPSPGVSIRVQTTAINAIIELQDMNGNLIDTENINSAVGNETLNIGNLTEGNQYRFAVRNYNSAQGTGTFTICVSRFNDSMCGSTNTSYPFCALFKALNVNAASYTYRFMHSQTNVVYSGTINSTYILLYNIPGLLQNATYSVTIDANFNVTNGLNQVENITIVGTVACTITILPHTVQYLRTADACPNVRQLTSTIKCEPAICSASDYEWEFTRIAPTAGTPITKFTGSNSQYMLLSTVAGLTNGTYNVRIRPIFPNGSLGNYCPVQCLQIGTNASGMIQADDNGTQNEYFIERTEESAIDIYPVPANQSINILSEEAEISSIEIYDLSGKMALYKNTVNGNFIELNLADLPNGIYFLRANLANADVVSRKMMVAH
jgi:hypothetical protein